MTRRQFFAAIPAAVLTWLGWRSKPKPDFVRVVRDGETFLRFPGLHAVWLDPEELEARRTVVREVFARAKAAKLAGPEYWTADPSYDFGGADQFWSVQTPVKRGVADVRSDGK